MKCLNIIYNYDKIADLNKMKRIIQIKLSKINKKVLTNTNTNAIIMTSKEKRNKKENHSIHSIYKCYMKRMNQKKGLGDSVEKVTVNHQYEVIGIEFPARKTWYIINVKENPVTNQKRKRKKSIQRYRNDFSY